jgi:hypothetical protein
VPQPQTCGFITTLWRQVRPALAHCGAWVRRLSGTMRGWLARGAARRARTERDCRYLEARARFWAEVRAGQREAEALSARRTR